MDGSISNRTEKSKTKTCEQYISPFTVRMAVLPTSPSELLATTWTRPTSFNLSLSNVRLRKKSFFSALVLIDIKLDSFSSTSLRYLQKDPKTCCIKVQI